MNDLRALLRRDMLDSRHRVMRTVMVKPDKQASIVKRAVASQATVSDCARELRGEGVEIFEDKVGAGNSDYLRMAPTTGMAVGIELGFQRTAVVARKVDQTHDEAQADWIHIGAANGHFRTDLPRELWERLTNLAGRLGEDPQNIATVGIAVPRMINPRDQKITPPLLPPWDTGVDPCALIAEHLRQVMGERNLPHISMDNDANLGALGESTYGNYADSETLIYVKASTGIGAGIVIGGNLIRGRVGVAGEIGHAMVDPRGRVCLCGGRGCLETLVGSDALLEQARTALAGRPARSPGSFDAFMGKAVDGDPVCLRVLTDAAVVLGAALGNVCNLLNPNVIVIGGTWGAIAKPGIVLDPCRTGLESTALNAAYAPGFELTTSRVPFAVAHGALIMGILGAPADQAQVG